MQDFIVVSKIYDGEYPMYFPIYTKDSELLYKRLKQYNIISGIQPFWNHMHKFLNWKLFKKEAILKKSLLVFPTSYFMGEKNLEIIAKEFSSL
jgi:hypothetical protein